MADVFSKRKRSKVMATVRGRANKSTEMRLLRILRKNHIAGWRRHLPMIGQPDFTFSERRLTIFVDGCFWHGCPEHLRLPSSNSDYWRRKISTNCVRDLRVLRDLKRSGWRVMRIWEHELQDEKRIIRRVRLALGPRERN